MRKSEVDLILINVLLLSVIINKRKPMDMENCYEIACKVLLDMYKGIDKEISIDRRIAEYDNRN